jgi:hypothetical protein
VVTSAKKGAKPQQLDQQLIHDGLALYQQELSGVSVELSGGGCRACATRLPKPHTRACMLTPAAAADVCAHHHTQARGQSKQRSGKGGEHVGPGHDRAGGERGGERGAGGDRGGDRGVGQQGRPPRGPAAGPRHGFYGSSLPKSYSRWVGVCGRARVGWRSSEQHAQR